MLAVEKCKKILLDSGSKQYTDDEIIKIREFLYTSAKLIVESKSKLLDDA
jgi:hypothetical protein